MGMDSSIVRRRGSHKGKAIPATDVRVVDTEKSWYKPSFADRRIGNSIPPPPNYPGYMEATQLIKEILKTRSK